MRTSVNDFMLNEKTEDIIYRLYHKLISDVGKKEKYLPNPNDCVGKNTILFLFLTLYIHIF